MHNYQMIAVYCSFQTCLKPRNLPGAVNIASAMLPFPLPFTFRVSCLLSFWFLQIAHRYNFANYIWSIRLFARLWFILIFVTRKSVFYLTFYFRFECIFFTLPSILQKWIIPVSLNQKNLSRFFTHEFIFYL